MIQAIQKLKNRKGFTLVELIVVLVILAILAALLVPALTGYIDKAKKQQIIAETRMVVMAAQTELDEYYAKYGLNNGGSFKDTGAVGTVSMGSNVKILAEVSGEFTVTYNKSGQVTDVVYSRGTTSCTYTWNSGSTGTYNVS